MILLFKIELLPNRYILYDRDDKSEKIEISIVIYITMPSHLKLSHHQINIQKSTICYILEYMFCMVCYHENTTSSI